MNVVPELNLNRHPKDCKPYSLTFAKNIRVSDDGSCLQSENSILIENTIMNAIKRKFNANYKIIHVAATNTELIIFVIDSTRSINANGEKCYLYRYSEELDKCELKYSNFIYYGGKIKDTFTYNGNNDLILAISEYDSPYKKYIPLVTINLGKFNDSEYDPETSDLNIPFNKLSLIPEVKLPNIDDVSYVPGKAYKGWYNIFIRYKINKFDYTKWYHIGYPIFVDTIELRSIIKYIQITTQNNDFISPLLNTVGAGCSDEINNESDICDETIQLELNSVDNSYGTFQLGFICSTKTVTRAFATEDLTNSSFTLNLDYCREISSNELIIDYYNYFNVRNLINYNNQLYISNYDESASINNSQLITFADNILLSPVHYKLNYDDIQQIKRISDNITPDGYIEANPDLYASNDEKISFKETVTINNPDFDKFYIKTTTGVKINVAKVYKHKTEPYTYYQLWFYSDVNLHYIEIRCTSLLNNVNITYGNSSFTERVPAPKRTIESSELSYSYVNAKRSFNNRKLNTTLLPGEVYNFYVHFVDKYGTYSQGYKINNYYDIRYNEVLVSNYILIHLIDDYYLYVDPTEPIITHETTSNGTQDKLNYLDIVKVYGITGNRVIVRSESNNQNIMNYLSKLFDKYKNIDNPNFVWCQIDENYVHYDDKYLFGKFINENNEVLFKVPKINDIFVNDNTYEVDIFNLNMFVNKNLPDDYVGYFLSYEKFESQIKYTGVICKADITDKQDKEPWNDYKNKKDKINFYSSDINIYNDKLFCNVLYVKGYDFLSTVLSDDNVLNKNLDNFVNYNIIKDKSGSITNTYFSINDYSVKKSTDVSIVGQSSYIELNDIEALFKDDKLYRTYQAELINYTRNLYINSVKTLIKFTNIFTDTVRNENVIINRGFNGHYTYKGILIYNGQGASLNTGYNVVNSKVTNKSFILNDKNTIITSYIQLPCYSQYVEESRSFKDAPRNISYITQPLTDSSNEKIESANKIEGCFVEPMASIDLFENNYLSQDDFIPKAYLNYDKNVTYLTRFDKTIRRSAIIADESSENGWRRFPVESYKQLSENKGIITNLVEFGKMILVHTEHSLFMLTSDNNLTTNEDSIISLESADILAVNFRELMTSNKGSCGLQDDKAFIKDYFGYIFYDNDAYSFYRFGQNGIELISNTITQFLSKYKPHEVRFAHDVKSSRILIRLKYKDVETEEKELTLSFHYGLSTFVSYHTHGFDEAISTKNNVYYRYDVVNNVLYKPDYNELTNNNYQIFENVKHENVNTKGEIHVIINVEYETVKDLEFIIYKLYKRIKTTKDFDFLPVEEEKQPYAGEYIRVYNNLVDTGWINVSINEESEKNLIDNYKKPYWDLDNWNFNYLRDTKHGNDADEMSRLYGNYFIVAFRFADDNIKTEFESVDCNIIKNR